MTRREDLAWAAGFFDGEGCVSSVKRGNQGGKQRLVSGACAISGACSVVQSNREELDRFLSIVGCGNIHGPYRAKNNTKWKDRFQWSTHERENIRKIGKMLSPFLCSRKRNKFVEVLRLWDEYCSAPKRKRGKK